MNKCPSCSKSLIKANIRQGKGVACSDIQCNYLDIELTKVTYDNVIKSVYVKKRKKK